MPSIPKPRLLRGALRSTRGVWIALLALVALGTLWSIAARTGESAVTLPAPATDNPHASRGTSLGHAEDIRDLIEWAACT